MPSQGRKGQSVSVVCPSTHLPAPPPNAKPHTTDPNQAQARIAAKEAENGELLAMCDQLLAQHEAVRCAAAGAAAGDIAGAFDQQ